jgi:hypothetical protein
MAKTTATVTVGADTKPFARAMRGLGKSVTGGVTAGVGRAGGMAMSGLGAGLGIGAAFLGLQGLGSIFEKMRAVSPELNAELMKLKVAVGDALFPAAAKLAEVLRDNMPAIESGLSAFGTMLSDAIQFWTEDAFNPEVWKDIGVAISESISEALNLLPGGVESAGREIGGALGGEVGAEAGAGAAGALTDALTTFNPMYWLYKYNEAAAGLVFGKSDEGASAL